MTFWLCPRATAQPLLGLAARTAVPARTTRVTSREALRWFSCYLSPLKAAAGHKAHNRSSTRPRFTPVPSTYLPRGAFDRRTFFSRRIPTRYEHLPADYRDEVGLEFRTTELSQDEVNGVFRRGLLSAKDGNTLLRILHGRRVAGTLEDPAYAKNTARFSKEQIQRGLEYLRVTVPVDETVNAGLRAEDELAEIEREEKMKEQDLDPATSETVSKGLSLKISPLYKVDPTYGESRFDQIRAENEAKSAALEAAREARRRADEEAAGGAEALERARAGPVALVKEDGGKIMNPKIAEYYVKAQEQGDLEPEFLSFWQRVLPSITLVTLVIGFLAAVTTVYEEPADTYRMIRSLSTAQATVGAIIGVNLLAFVGWRIPPLWGLFNRYMIFVVGKVKPVTLLTAPFSHQSFGHLLKNMIPLWFVGTALHGELDRAQFLTLYVACGAAGYLTSLLFYTARGWLSVSSLGASGCTLGVITAYFWEHKGDGFKFLGMPQEGVPGLVLLALVLALQLSYLGKAMRSKIDLANHFGGIAMGLLGMEIIQWRRRGGGKAIEADETIIMKKLEIDDDENLEEGEEAKKEEKSYIEVLGWWLDQLKIAHGVSDGGQRK